MMRNKRGILIVLGGLLLALFVGCSKAEGEMLEVLDTELELRVLRQNNDGSLWVYEVLSDPNQERPYRIDRIQGFTYPGRPAYILVKKLRNKETKEIQYVYVRDLKREDS